MSEFVLTLSTGFLVELAQLTNPALRQIEVVHPVSLDLPAVTKKRKAPAQLYEFNLFSLETVEQALSAFR